MSAETLIQEARKLSVAERMRIAEEMWDSIGDDQAPSLTADQRDELERRLADCDANPQAGSTWQEVQARIEKKLGC